MRISRLTTLKSNAGYYVGRAYWDEDCEAWFPYSRDSFYFLTEKEADEWLAFLLDGEEEFDKIPF